MHEDKETAERDAPLGSVRQAARHYLARGWRVVELRARSKAPAQPGWQDMRLSEAVVDATFLPGGNIGLLSGEASGGVVDVDCDAPEAVIAAGGLLPTTGMAHRRAGGLLTHYWYLIDGELPATAKYQWLEGTVPTKATTMLIELRANGCQTMVPPSTHPHRARQRPGDGGELRAQLRSAT